MAGEHCVDFQNGAAAFIECDHQNGIPALILTPQAHCNLEVIEANGILLWEKETIFHRKSRGRDDPGYTIPL